jgi:hypothetical protein
MAKLKRQFWNQLEEPTTKRPPPKGFPSLRSKWYFEHKKWVKIIPRDAYTYLEYHFYDKREML